ncbi:hypothetical protein ACHQM5_010608 [Ranunculus cassubicifolius]
MEVTGDIRTMVAERNGSQVNKIDINLHKAAGRNYLKSRRRFGMAFEANSTKPISFISLTTQTIRSGTTFMAWSGKIPIGEGYHEFL